MFFWWFPVIVSHSFVTTQRNKKEIFLGALLTALVSSTVLLFLVVLTVTWPGRYYSSHNVHLYWLVLQSPCDSCWHVTLSTAHLDATRALMILSLLACFIGIIIGIMAFIHYSSFDRFDKTFAAGILFFISCKCDSFPQHAIQFPLLLHSSWLQLLK